MCTIRFFPFFADPVCNFQSPPERKFKPFQTTCGEPEELKEKFPAQDEASERPVEAQSNCSGSLPDSKDSIKPLSRRASEAGRVVDCADNQSASSPTVLNVPASPSDLRSGKRVRKLKKKKGLKKAQGAEQPASSDSETEEELMRPRWLRQRRRPSAASQVSTSSQPTDDRDIIMGTDGNKKGLSLTLEEEKEQASNGKTAPPINPMGSTNVEESMEVTAAGQLMPHPPELVLDSCRPETQNLACNEVSSTSDMDLCKSSDR